MTKKSEENSQLDHIIPPEIKNDEFYYNILKLAKNENLKTVLEIGSSAGRGSTEAIVAGLLENSNQPNLYCLEISKVRYEELRINYAHFPFVKCHNVSSVSADKFPKEEEVINFYKSIKTVLNNYSIGDVLNWLRQDVEYLENSGVPDNGISAIKKENDIVHFDMVLIDGSEFTGKAELDEVYGAKIILLDDINAYKNNYNYMRLKNDPNYSLLTENWKLRNGYAIFKRKENEQGEYASIKNAVELIEGFMCPGQEEFLFNKVKMLPHDAVIVEIGSFKGRSTVAMGYACNGTNRKIYSIDTWDGNETDFSERNFFEIWQENIKINKVEKYVVPLRGNSHEILHQWNDLTGGKKIDFIFIDGSHQYVDVLKDFEMSYPLVKENGYVAFHDVVHTWPGPNHVWHEIAKKKLVNLEYSSSLAFGRKKSFSSEELPIHFFTIVLNGEPFIRYHIDVLKQLPFKWHWHIIEGVADLKHDTAWSLQLGGRIAGEFHNNGRSNDGTTEYIDELAEDFPGNVTIYRKPEGVFWDGKLEMVGAPLINIKERCLLWQVDSDELWTIEQVTSLRRLFLANPGRTAAFFHCHFFVGPDLVTITKDAYSHNSSYEWLRVWNFQPGMLWASHEPPRLAVKEEDEWKDLALINPFSHEETLAEGLIFTHYGYALESQVRFKEIYYGYNGAVNQWHSLLDEKKFPVYLRNYFKWVHDNAKVDLVERRLIGEHVSPVPWSFPESEALSIVRKKRPRHIVIDGVIFQLQSQRPLGISRVWRNLISELVKQFPTYSFTILKRRGFELDIEDVDEREVTPYHLGPSDVLDSDDAMLDRVCKELDADVFMSTYYTRVPGVHNILMLYDMIPEVMAYDMEQPEWLSKKRAIATADSFVSISHSTRNDLNRFYKIAFDNITVAHCGVSSEFTVASKDEISEISRKYNIDLPYFLLVGNRGLYKNCIPFFQAFASLEERDKLHILAVGGEPRLTEQEAEIAAQLNVRFIPWLPDAELKILYSGALALVYPSQYEGFGLPVLEAISCGCPVITTTKASLPEVGGDAALYVDPDSAEEIKTALRKVMKADVRQDMIGKGLKYAQKFSWQSMAKTVAEKISVGVKLSLQAKSKMSLVEKLLDPVIISEINELNKQGESFFAKGKIHDALELFLKALEIAPDYALSHNNLGVLYFDIGDKDKSFFHYHRAAELQPENSIFQKNLADFYYVIHNDINNAVPIYKQIIDKCPDDIEAFFALGKISKDVGLLKEAEQFFNKVLELQPDHAMALQEKGHRDSLHKEEAALNLKSDPQSGTEIYSPNNLKENGILVSAIVSTYNSEKFIKGCIEDLEAQTIADHLEIIVINSCSAQNEEDIVKQFQRKYSNIKYIKTDERETVYAAWNRGIKAASGKYITNANTDDRHRNDAYEVMVNVLESLPEVVLVYADIITTEAENETFEKCTPVGSYQWLNWNRQDLLERGCFMGPQPMWRKSVHEEYGYFNDKFVTSGDYEFWLRISQTNTFLHLPVFLGLYLKSPNSIEHSNRLKQRDENQEILDAYKNAHHNGQKINGLKEEITSRLDAGRDGLSNRKAGEIAENVKLKPVDKELTISFVIVVNSNFETLKTCVGSIKKSFPDKHEMLFVVSGSVSNKFKKWVDSKFNEHNTTIVPLFKGASVGKCYNAGLKEAAGEFIVLAHGDVVFSKSWPDSFIRNLKLSKSIGIVGPMLNNVSGLQECTEASLLQFSKFDALSVKFQEKYRYRRIAKDKLSSVCLMGRRNLFEEVGCFDEKFVMEDFLMEDFCRRIFIAGKENFIVADVLLYHFDNHKKKLKGEKKTQAFKADKMAYVEKWGAVKLDTPLGSRLLLLKSLDKAKTLEQQEEVEKAASQLLKTIAHAPNDKAAYLALAGLFFQAKQYDEALGVLEKFPDVKDPKYRELIGYCMEGKGNIEEAEKYAEKALSINSKSPQALNLKGVCLYKNGKKGESEEYIKKAIQSDPGYGEPYTNIGLIKWEVSPDEQALNYLEKGFALSPNIIDNATNYHSAITALGLFDRAESFFRDAVALYPHNKRLVFLYIDVLIKLNNYKSAMHEIENAIVYFGVDDGLLAAALNVRDILGPKEIAHGPQKRKTISVCIITKNEEKHIAKCLKSLSATVDEMIVVDTGSHDRTKDIAKIFGAKVFDSEWKDDFSEARNVSLAKANGEWILVLDADEVLSVKDYQLLHELVEKGTSKAYIVLTRNYVKGVAAEGWVANNGQYPEEEIGAGWYPSEKVRLFQRDINVRFENPVHELVEPALARNGISFINCNIVVHHYGRLDEKKVSDKGEIYYQLGLKKLKEQGGSLNALNELAVQAGELGRYEEAIELWKKVLKLVPQDASRAFLNMGFAYMQLAKYEASILASKQALEIAPNLKEAALNYATCSVLLGEIEEVILFLEGFLSKGDFYPSAMGILAAAYCVDNRLEKGRRLFTKVRSMGFNINPFIEFLIEKLDVLGKKEIADKLRNATVDFL